MSRFFLEYPPPESTGVITPVFSFFQNFNTGSIHPLKFTRNFFLILPFQAPAAERFPLHKGSFCHFRFISAVTLTQPAGSVSPVLCSVKDRQIPKCPAGQIFSDISSPGSSFGDAPAVAFTSPDTVSILRFICFFQYCQMSKSGSCQIFTSRHLLICHYCSASFLIKAGGSEKTFLKPPA